MVLKSGTQKFHGEVYEFNRNTAYNANDYFLKSSGKPRSKFQLNKPGGNIGGPLWIPACLQQRPQPHLLLRERRMAPADPGQRAFGAERHPGEQLPDRRRGSGLHPAQRRRSNRSASPAIPARLALYAADGLTAGQPFHANGTHVHDSRQPDGPERGACS